ncbi:putative cyclin [Helianthus annuus]|uniref:cyclin-D5-1 n=1 Tax=Helianthus annuus TaxID=4232 RepID=UPI000B8EEF5E|nr:cyclin-D5-1 [Helianthus annuus]KAJ0577622.1 putative cyclin [Helianthus annuus]KAJ0919494.1 putative cyclin [Helianthus annuus]
MADSSSPSSFSLSRFLSLETTDTGLAAADDEEDDLNELNEDEEYLRVLLDKESAHNRIDQPHVHDSILISRSEAIQWIFNVRSSLQFKFHTAYLSVTFIDRFISVSPSHITHDDKPWAIRLLAVACLSLAAKTIDRTNWQLSSLLQAEGFEFSNKAVQRMELLVLTTLDWRMCSITPFRFIGYFVSCLCNESSSRDLVSMISQIICAATIDLNIMAHRSSTIAMAATLMAVDQGLTRESMEIKVKTSWVNQLFDHVDVYTCYSRMLKLEPLKVNIFELDSTKNEENPSKRRKHS